MSANVTASILALSGRDGPEVEGPGGEAAARFLCPLYFRLPSEARAGRQLFFTSRRPGWGGESWGQAFCHPGELTGIYFIFLFSSERY